MVASGVLWTPPVPLCPRLRLGVPTPEQRCHWGAGPERLGLPFPKPGPCVFTPHGLHVWHMTLNFPNCV